jgi:predicted DsbA family dithiol-disulfide isomerase
MFGEAGLRYDPPPDVVPNSRAALRLAELARDDGRHDAMFERIMDAYWDEARNIGDLAVLRELGRDVGLPPDDVERVLAGDAYLERIDDSTRRAVAAGVTGVPAWVLDDRLLVLGAHPRETFEAAFQQLEAA